MRLFSIMSSDCIVDSFDILSKHIFEACGLKYSQLEREAESSDYEAYSFKVNNKSVRYRHAKITPSKIGQFVTIWKRQGKGPIRPYDSSDDVDLFVVSVKNNSHFGQFVFPKSILVKQGIFSVNDKGGKRAIRVYPPWDKTESKQAQKSQNWQLGFFIKIAKNASVDVQHFKSLYSA